MTEFNLSNEIIGCKNCLGEWIQAKKVKEAVRRLKEWVDNDFVKNNHPYPAKIVLILKKQIDKIFGDKLK